MRRGSETIGRMREVLVVGTLLAFGVMAWEQAAHAYLLGATPPAGDVEGWLWECTLVLPVGLAAAALALLWARMLRLGTSTTHVLRRAALASLFFALLFVPASGLIGAEEESGLLSLLAHGLHDALIGVLAALPLAAGALLAPPAGSRLLRRRPRAIRRAAPTSPLPAAGPGR